MSETTNRMPVMKRPPVLLPKAGESKPTKAEVHQFWCDHASREMLEKFRDSMKAEIAARFTRAGRKARLAELLTQTEAEIAKRDKAG